MSYVQKDNSGALFKNDKQGNEKRPDYTGNAQINGKPVRIAGWVKQGKRGTFMSLSFKEDDSAPRAPGAITRASTDNFDDDSEIPF